MNTPSQANAITSSIKATKVMSDVGITTFLFRAFSQPLKMLKQADATVSTFAVFWCICSFEGNTQVGVAKLAGVSPKTVSRIISQLGETKNGLGWIRQQVDEDDRRIRRLFLSRKGRTIHKRMIKDLAKYRDKLLAKEGAVLE